MNSNSYLLGWAGLDETLLQALVKWARRQEKRRRGQTGLSAKSPVTSVVSMPSHAKGDKNRLFRGEMR